MTRTGHETWRLDVPRAEQAPVPVRIATRRNPERIEINIGSGRPLLLDEQLPASAPPIQGGADRHHPDVR